MSSYGHPFNAFPDIELLVVAQLRSYVQPRFQAGFDQVQFDRGVYDAPSVQVTVDTATGTDLAQVLPFLLVSIVPGGGQAASFLEEDVVVDVTSFAGDRDSMWLLARTAHAAMRDLSPSVGIDWITVNSAPAYVDYHNPAIFRAEATYRVTTRASQKV